MSKLGRAPSAPLDKVEWRVDGNPVERNGGFVCRFVPYLDAAAVTDLLDEWVGPTGWRDSYEEGAINGRYVLWGHVEIRDGEEWIRKSDVGKPSNFEAEKGTVSDAFKRAACLKWGAGRNVYELPTLWAPCRTFTSNGKTQAAPNDQTLPAILRQLREKGYAADGGRLQADPPEGVDVETGEVARPAQGGVTPNPCAVCQQPLGDAPVRVVSKGVYAHKKCGDDPVARGEAAATAALSSPVDAGSDVPAEPASPVEKARAELARKKAS